MFNEQPNIEQKTEAEDPEKKREIEQIEEFMFRGTWERIGADCSGDSRGECAKSNRGKCGEFHCCECAVEAMGDTQECPKFVSPEQARAEAEKFYNQVHDLEKVYSERDKDFERSYQFIAPDGSTLKPNYALYRTDERTEENLEWFDRNDLKDCLILMTDTENENHRQEEQNNSRYKLPSKLTPEQAEQLKKFCEEHGLELN